MIFKVKSEKLKIRISYKRDEKVNKKSKQLKASTQNRCDPNVKRL